MKDVSVRMILLVEVGGLRGNLGALISLSVNQTAEQVFLLVYELRKSKGQVLYNAINVKTVQCTRVGRFPDRMVYHGCTIMTVSIKILSQ